jgi:hypothetical protein
VNIRSKENKILAYQKRRQLYFNVIREYAAFKVKDLIVVKRGGSRFG